MRKLIVGMLFIGLAGCGKDDNASAQAGKLDGHIVLTIFCVGTTSNAATGGEALNGRIVSYDAAVNDSGDVFATAAVADGSYQASGTTFFSKSQVGADTGAVVVVNDYIAPYNGGYWTVSADRNAKTVTAVYKDVDFSSGQKFTFTPASCVVNSY
jgi:hypothetical protein